MSGDRGRLSDPPPQWPLQGAAWALHTLAPTIPPLLRVFWGWGDNWERVLLLSQSLRHSLPGEAQNPQRTSYQGGVRVPIPGVGGCGGTEGTYSL